MIRYSTGGCCWASRLDDIYMLEMLHHWKRSVKTKWNAISILLTQSCQHIYAPSSIDVMIRVKYCKETLFCFLFSLIGSFDWSLLFQFLSIWFWFDFNFMHLKNPCLSIEAGGCLEPSSKWMLSGGYKTFNLSWSWSEDDSK